MFIMSTSATGPANFCYDLAVGNWALSSVQIIIVSS